jgi:hypothetical protein
MLALLLLLLLRRRRLLRRARASGQVQEQALWQRLPLSERWAARVFCTSP